MNRPGLVITCEHGGNDIPAAYRHHFQGQDAVLESHRGFDAGALLMAEDLAKSFGAPLVSATVSRLLVDLNRSEHNHALHATVIRRLPAAERQHIVARYYQPFRRLAEDTVRQTLARHGTVVHLSTHSFTPVLDGRVRRADIGLLYDPRRPGERTLCEHWKAVLSRMAPELTVRRNYPYAGKGDGLTSHLRRHLGPEAYLGIELEINQRRIVATGIDWPELRRLIITSLGEALHEITASAPPFPAP